MTVQAYAWAIDQQIPGKTKLVLLALSNHADHTTGQVHFDLSTIARESCIPDRSLWRYLGALERNGYLSHDNRKSPEGDKRDYWLAFDRDPIHPWSWSAQDGDREDDDGEAIDRPAETSKLLAPVAFRPALQAEQRKAVAATDIARTDGLVPVIEGSKAFNDWCADFRKRGRVPPFVHTIVVDGKERRGFLMPSLFPPANRESAA